VADRQLIGFIGLSHHRWYPDEVEVGWRLDSRYWGGGLATEGAAAALRHGFAEIGLGRVISIIHHDNVASRRVAEKIGLRLWKEVTHSDPETQRPLPIVVYAIERTDWEAESRLTRPS
jgi:RimJ/RimL family protein N-acetyltransferase